MYTRAYRWGSRKRGAPEGRPGQPALSEDSPYAGRTRPRNVPRAGVH